MQYALVSSTCKLPVAINMTLAVERDIKHVGKLVVGLNHNIDILHLSIFLFLYFHRLHAFQPHCIQPVLVGSEDAL